MTTNRIRRSVSAVLTGVVLSGAAMLGMSSAAQAVEDAPPIDNHGCPLGAVCVYPDASWNGGNPTYAFYSYGAHKIYNQYGKHRVFNNQYGEGYAALSPDSDGSSWGRALEPGEVIDVNLTSVNSILLWER
ncbi:MAG TPA: hypothetical protein VK060_05925 [Ruania sp.]|nr:hypothetical protein [Ruania sp.]